MNPTELQKLKIYEDINNDYVSIYRELVDNIRCILGGRIDNGQIKKTFHLDLNMYELLSAINNNIIGLARKESECDNLRDKLNEKEMKIGKLEKKYKQKEKLYGGISDKQFKEINKLRNTITKLRKDYKILQGQSIAQKIIITTKNIFNNDKQGQK